MGTSRLRMVKWLAQGFTAKEWLSLKDDPRNPASQDSIHWVGGRCCLSGCRALWAVPPWPSLVPYLLPWRLLHLLQLLCLARPCSMCSGLWLLPAWFPGSCGRASFAWSSGSSWPALHLRIFSPSLCCLWTVWAYQGQPGSFGFIFLLWVTLAFSLRGRSPLIVAGLCSAPGWSPASPLTAPPWLTHSLMGSWQAGRLSLMPFLPLGTDRSFPTLRLQLKYKGYLQNIEKII